VSEPTRNRRRLRRWPAILLAPTLVAFVALWASSAGLGAAASRGAGSRVQIVFVGKGGGRYLDVTRWLREATRECYARRTADETVAVSWRLVWTARLTRTSRGIALAGVRASSAAVAGRVRGTSVRDSCDAAEEEEPGWAGTSHCDSPMPVVARGALAADRASSGVSLSLRGPTYGGPSHPCELDIRNDQLGAHFLLGSDALAKLAAGGAVKAPVGTDHARAGDRFERTRQCSAFPHIYEGVVYIYDCEDTLAWSGTLSVTPA
jgi:hypothetical protein